MIVIIVLDDLGVCTFMSMDGQLFRINWLDNLLRLLLLRSLQQVGILGRGSH
jgi:hypothetical protein